MPSKQDKVSGLHRSFMIESKKISECEICLESQEDLPAMVKVSDFFVQKEVFDFHYDCDYTFCKGCCCSEGCWICHDEKLRISSKIKEIAEYLRVRPELPFWKEGADQWEFTDPIPDEGQWHSRVVGGTCIFQIPDGRCSIHAYCKDKGIPWEEFKVWICVDFPLSFLQRDNTWYVRIHKEVPEPYWDHCACIRQEKLPPERRARLPPVIESMKSTIISRIGPERYKALVGFYNNFVQDKTINSPE